LFGRFRIRFVAMPTIAVLGASENRSKFGNKAVRAYRAAGWTVHPINPHEREVEGLATLGSVTEVAGPLDRITVYLPPPVTLAVLPEIERAAAGEVWFNPGSADAEVLAEARRRAVPVREGCSIVDIGYSPSEFPA
jgi:predicted CoA-binding protein